MAVYLLFLAIQVPTFQPLWVGAVDPVPAIAEPWHFGPSMCNLGAGIVWIQSHFFVILRRLALELLKFQPDSATLQQHHPSQPHHNGGTLRAAHFWSSARCRETPPAAQERCHGVGENT